MQKVERRKHGDRRRKRLAGVILCAVLLAACVTAGFLLRKKAQEPLEKTQQRVTGTIVQRDAEDLDSLTVTLRGKEPWTVVREEDGSLRLRQDDNPDTSAWIVDRTIGNRLTDVAVNLSFEDVFTENRGDWEPEAEDFGLKDPLVTAVFRYKDGTEKTVRIGGSADPGENTHYYMTVDGDDRLYAVAAGTVEDLNTEKELLHPVHRLEIRSALLDRITVKNGDGTVRMEWTLQGKITDQDAAENWLLTAPVIYPADYDTMKNLRDTAENLRLGIYVGNAEGDTLNQYGLDEPTAIIELHMAAGSTGTVSDAGVYDVEDREECTETLTVGSSKSDMVAYVLYGDEICTMSHFSLKTFTEQKYMQTAARYTVATPLSSLESVTVEKQGEETVLYSLVMTETTEGEEGTAYKIYVPHGERRNAYSGALRL